MGRITELKGGMFNSAYLIERPGINDKIVLKVSAAPETEILSYEKDIMRTEVAVYKLIGEKTSVPTPRLLAYDFSRQHIASDYFFMTALEGIPMHKLMRKLSKDNLEALKNELADCFAQLHMIKGPYFGYFSDDKHDRFKTWKKAFLHMMEMIVSDCKEHSTDIPYERLMTVLKEKSGYLEDVKEPVLVDYDLWPGNIFLKNDGGRFVIEGIIDFERAFWGDPLAEFPSAAMFIKDITSDPAFWNIYKGRSQYAGELDKEADIRLTFYSLYLWTIMTVETFRYGLLHRKLQESFSKKNLLKCLEKLERAEFPTSLRHD